MVIVQANPLNTAFDTLLVVPLDIATDAYTGNPTAVLISRREIGEHVDYVALTTQLRPVAADALAPGVVGRLSPRTQTRLDRVLRLVLAL